VIRRDALLGIALLAVWLRRTEAQATRLPRVALVFVDTTLADMAGPDPASPYARAFVHALRDLGYVEGRDIVIERRSTEGRPERLASVMHEVVALKVDVIVTTGRGSSAAAQATMSIPILALTDDPVLLGLVESLARPGRNLTGVASTAGPEIVGKRLELLKETLPSLSRVAVIDFKYIDSASTPGTHIRRLAIAAAARALGVDAAFVGVDTAQDFEPAFAAIVAGRAQAILVGDTSVNQIHQARIIDFAERQRLPAIADEREFTAAGGLMSYGTAAFAVWARVAQYVDRILKGAKPSDLPYQQPMQYELLINLKTARTLGLTIPRSILLRADALIE
jgi:putative ABC transport system substrate-binding protein